METYSEQQKEKHKLFEETYNLAKVIYQHNNVGGMLHIVLDDGNLDNSNIQFCIDCINESDEPKEIKNIYLKCAKNMLRMTRTQRLKLYKSDYRF